MTGTTAPERQADVIVVGAGPAGASTAFHLAQAGADVLVCDVPGQAAALRAANPTAVIVTLPPWGERGPRVHEPATADLVAASLDLAAEVGRR